MNNFGASNVRIPKAIRFHSVRTTSAYELNVLYILGFYLLLKLRIASFYSVDKEGNIGKAS